MSGESRGALDLDKLYAARLHAARARPYLATALFALYTVESRRVPTMAVDRHWRCYVSPAFVDRMPVEELAGVWVHEVSHLLRDHHGRGDRVARERGLHGPGSGCGGTSPRTARSTTTRSATGWSGPETWSIRCPWGCPRGSSWRTTCASSR